jgi:HEPN domain-containing protein
MNAHEEWLKLADEDFGAARYLAKKKEYFGIACFHAQQASEKYLKAYLVLKKIDFPKTHDIEYLLELIEKVDAGIAEKLLTVTKLNKYAVRLRYPGESFKINKKEAALALEMALSTKAIIEKALSR